MQHTSSNIPKIIHYCWFGGNPKSTLILKCIASWQKYLPDYELMEWNEQSFDVFANLYTKQAFEHKKWAFVSDYARLYALYNHGGIYLDTDVEIFQNLDIFLQHTFFSGFEKTYKGGLSPITALIGAQKKHVLISELLAAYNECSFIDTDNPNKLDLTTNTHRISQHLIQAYQVKINDTYQVLQHDVHIYPSNYFCNYGHNTYAVHHFSASWKPWYRRVLSKILAKIMRLILP
jgi:Glycosyltransferase sugar-binding region containing DXD motif